MPPRDLNDFKHWRERAEKIRTLANEMKESEPRHLMLDLAKDYDLLADRAAERIASDDRLQPRPSPVSRTDPE